MSTDTDRVEVRVRLPAYQKAEWVDDAEELGMSQAEFVRTMVQAGRRDLGLADDSDSAEERSGEDTDPPTSPPGGDGLEDRVLGVVREEGPASWETLLDAAVDDVEDRLDETLGALQAEGRVRYSGREGGYVATDE